MQRQIKSLLKRIYSFLLALTLVVGLMNNISPVYGTETEGGDGDGSGNVTEGFAVGGFSTYKVTFFRECYELDPIKLRSVEGQSQAEDGVHKFKTFWVNFNALPDRVGGQGTQLGHYGMDGSVQIDFDNAMEDWDSSFTFFIGSKSDALGQKNGKGTVNAFYRDKKDVHYPSSTSMSIASPSNWNSSSFNIVDFDSQIKGDSFWNSSSMSDFLNMGNSSIDVGLNKFSNPETKAEAYKRLLDIAGFDSPPIAYDDFNKYGIVIVQKCTIIGAPQGVTASGYGDKNASKRLYCYTWHDCWKAAVARGASLPSGIKGLIPGTGNKDVLYNSGNFVMVNYAPMVESGYLNPFSGDPSPFTVYAGFGLWGLTTTDSAGTATNTLAVYNADPVTGGTADPTKWEIYSTIVDGKMPDTPDGTCEDLKFWNKTDWKSASKFLEAIDGSTSDTLQNIDNGEYAMIARDSYRNVAVPAYKSVLMSGVVANNDKAQEATKLLEKAPENVVWGAKTVSELTGNADSFGNVITIATLNGMPFGNNTSGYAQTENGLQMVGGVRKAGTLTNDPILEQVNNEIKNAFTQSSSGNWTGTGVGTHFTTDTSALGSAVEIVVKGKPVESDLHVVSVFDGVATLTPNVKNYKYTTVNYGIVDPQLDSGVSDTVQAVILVPKDGTPTGDSITSSMQGTTPDNAISTFIGLSEDSREGAPIINVGNKDDKGYDIYVLIFSEPPAPVEGAVELPDYLLNLYYNRVWYYTTKGEEFKVNWERYTYPHLSSDGTSIDGVLGGDKEKDKAPRVCWYKAHEWAFADWNSGEHCGGVPSRKHGDHTSCSDFYAKADLDKYKDDLHKYWTVSYRDVSPEGADDGGNNSAMKWEKDSGRKNVYYTKASFSAEAGQTDTTYIWDKSKPSILGESWYRTHSTDADGNISIGDTNAAVDTHKEGDLYGENILFDYAYNLTRASSKDNRTLSAIGYESIGDSPSVNGVDNFLKLKFGDKPDSPLVIGTERSSDAKITTDYTQELTFNSAFTWDYGTTANDNSDNTGNGIKSNATPLDYPTTQKCYKCDGAGKDEVHEVKDETTGAVTTPHADATACSGGVSACKTPTFDHCPHCGGTHASSPSDSHINFVSKECSDEKDGYTRRWINDENSIKVNGFIGHFGTSDTASKISQKFEQLVYKYQTGSMPTGINTKLGQNSASKRATKRQGDIAEHNESYRMAFNYGSTASALKYFPEVKMGYYRNEGDTLSDASVTDTYNGRNLLDSNKTASDDGAAFNVAHSTLYTMGEKERSVKPSSLYLYRIGSNGGNSVNGSTASDSMLSSSHSNSLDKVTIPAGTDMTMKANPENLNLNLYGYALDIIKKDDNGKLVGDFGSSYMGYVKSDFDVYGDWGNNGSNYKPKDEFETWKRVMLNAKNYNADAILEVNGSRVYNNFTAAFGGFKSVGNTDESKVYVLHVEHGQLQSTAGYTKLMEQIAEDYDCTQAEANALFEASGIPQSIIDSLEHDTASQNKSDGKGNLDGFKVWNDFQLGSSAHWYDEMTRTFVVRRYAVENIGLKDVVLQDKLDLSDSANTNYGSRTNRSNNNRQYGNDKTVGAKWFVSIFFSPSSLTGSGDIKQNLLTSNPSPYKPANNSGTSLTQLIEGSNSYRESGVIVISNAPVHGADFLVPSSTTSNFGD